MGIQDRDTEKEIDRGEVLDSVHFSRSRKNGILQRKKVMFRGKDKTRKINLGEDFIHY